MSRRREWLSFDVLLFLVFLAAGLLAISFAPTARMLPLAVCVIAVVLMLVQVWVDFVKKPAIEADADDYGEPEENESEKPETGWKGPLFSFVWLAGFVLFIWLLGYLIATPIFVFAFMTFAGGVRWKTAAAVTVGVWACTYLLLMLVLNVQ